MKGLLLDENIPRHITFAPGLPLIHATDLGNHLSDSEIWDHARKNSLAIVTKDADFSNRIMTSEPPPWIVHLRFGNMRLREYHAFFQRVWPQIATLLPAHKLIHVYPDKIEGVRG